MDPSCTRFCPLADQTMVFSGILLNQMDIIKPPSLPTLWKPEENSPDGDGQTKLSSKAVRDEPKGILWSV
ncbi:unnamed protein product [Prunus armeniaca]|uniref:Uncharacterized protein n=1 Tax=Prunus armeniaca TaxID=36596 RepID=A0A6J5XE24_PRUAR|nr:unnamed protein product [Prunus armeniaca]CAB4312100.1 unnamed protein product [Prunus armeniaca]